MTGLYLKNNNIIVANIVFYSLMIKNFYSELYNQKFNSVRFSCWHSSIDMYEAILI